jgi:DNA-binding response OmpR family regulator|tara:strand:+ start:622 stop:756 length:135 start_codon:yes stop_codon:yes gene_type:complete
MLTALSGEEDRRVYVEWGATWLIPKPFDLIELPDQVAAAVGWNT